MIYISEFRLLDEFYFISFYFSFSKNLNTNPAHKPAIKFTNTVIIAKFEQQEKSDMENKGSGSIIVQIIINAIIFFGLLYSMINFNRYLLLIKRQPD